MGIVVVTLHQSAGAVQIVVPGYRFLKGAVIAVGPEEGIPFSVPGVGRNQIPGAVAADEIAFAVGHGHGAVSLIGEEIAAVELDAVAGVKIVHYVAEALAVFLVAAGLPQIDGFLAHGELVLPGESVLEGKLGQHHALSLVPVVPAADVAPLRKLGVGGIGHSRGCLGFGRPGGGHRCGDPRDAVTGIELPQLTLDVLLLGRKGHRSIGPRHLVGPIDEGEVKHLEVVEHRPRAKQNQQKQGKDAAQNFVHIFPFLGEGLFEKSPSPNPTQKLSRNPILQFFGKGFGENLFFKKGFPQMFSYLWYFVPCWIDSAR